MNQPIYNAGLDWTQELQKCKDDSILFKSSELEIPFRIQFNVIPWYPILVEDIH